MASTDKVTIQITVEINGGIEEADAEKLKGILTREANRTASKWYNVEIAKTDCYCMGFSHIKGCKFHVVPY